MFFLVLEDFVTNAKVHDNYIRDCGIYDFVFDDGGKTGEGICEYKIPFRRTVRKMKWASAFFSCYLVIQVATREREPSPGLGGDGDRGVNDVLDKLGVRQAPPPPPFMFLW